MLLKRAENVIFFRKNEIQKHVMMLIMRYFLILRTAEFAMAFL